MDGRCIGDDADDDDLAKDASDAYERFKKWDLEVDCNP